MSCRGGKALFFSHITVSMKQSLAMLLRFLSEAPAADAFFIPSPMAAEASAKALSESETKPIVSAIVNTLTMSRFVSRPSRMRTKSVTPAASDTNRPVLRMYFSSAGIGSRVRSPESRRTAVSLPVAVTMAFALPPVTTERAQTIFSAMASPVPSAI